MSESNRLLINTCDSTSQRWLLRKKSILANPHMNLFEYFLEKIGSRLGSETDCKHIELEISYASSYQREIQLVFLVLSQNTAAVYTHVEQNVMQEDSKYIDRKFGLTERFGLDMGLDGKER
ncbi:hypothetical protein GcM3_208032 [Golovinomyces cichoracearum]|uniref:Uncharacterized protein n=1 Tax=Golovinomyces cichoracearum TaxID=62708 RepID=A0A420HAW0_9PEZI|nr:hypothetical protein GcM3_208032 [Golovinomyces cichoracearum]